MAVVLILVLIVVGSVLFHVLSPWWWTPIASNWTYIDTTLVITFWITGIVFVAVVSFMAYCVFRFRHKPGNRAHYEPENRRLELLLGGGTALGVAAMLAPGLIVWNQFITVPADAASVEVVSQQWLWSFRLPGADGKLGRAETGDVTPKTRSALIKTTQAASTTSSSRAANSICRSASRCTYCCARSMCSMISTCRNSAPRWT